MTRPDCREILEGIGATLAERVLPRVEDAYLEHQIGAMLALLGLVADNLDGEADRLIKGNRRASELVERGELLLAAMHGDARPNDQQSDPKGVSAVEGSTVLSELNAQRVALDGALCELVEECEELLVLPPSALTGEILTLRLDIFDLVRNRGWELPVRSP